MTKKDPQQLRKWFAERDTEYDNTTEAIWLYVANSILAAFSDIVGVSVNNITWKDINLRGDILVISCRVPQTKQQFESIVQLGYFNIPDNPLVDDMEFIEYTVGVPLSLVGQSPEAVKEFFKSSSGGDESKKQKSTTTATDFDYSTLSEDQTLRMVLSTLSVQLTKQ